MIRLKAEISEKLNGYDCRRERKKLKHAGFTEKQIHDGHMLFGIGTVDKIVRGEARLNLQTVNRLCEMFGCRVEDVIEYVPDGDAAGEDQQMHMDITNADAGHADGDGEPAAAASVMGKLDIYGAEAAQDQQDGSTGATG